MCTPQKSSTRRLQAVPLVPGGRPLGHRVEAGEGGEATAPLPRRRSPERGRDRSPAPAPRGERPERVVDRRSPLEVAADPGHRAHLPGEGADDGGRRLAFRREPGEHRERPGGVSREGRVHEVEGGEAGSVGRAVEHVVDLDPPPGDEEGEPLDGLGPVGEVALAAVGELLDRFGRGVEPAAARALPEPCGKGGALLGPDLDGGPGPVDRPVPRGALRPRFDAAGSDQQHDVVPRSGRERGERLPAFRAGPSARETELDEAPLGEEGEARRGLPEPRPVEAGLRVEDGAFGEALFAGGGPDRVQRFVELERLVAGYQVDRLESPSEMAAELLGPDLHRGLSRRRSRAAASRSRPPPRGASRRE